ncbi:MAG TPA: transcription antitermination factor NusB [Acidothermaceae bacterium]|jgi:N utilization substance protein B|nr:transcription antitermination factor NusB [Acidothermaceae bacterium]
MSARTKARKRALDVLFECDVRSSDALETLAQRLAQAEPPVPEYTVTLVEGVVEHRDRIDDLIQTHSQGWTLERMPVVDRNLLRIGIFELLWVDETPDGVVLSEAVNLAQQLSTDESAAFVNGVLAKLLGEKPTLAV